ALMQAVWNEYRAAEAANGADTWLAPFAVIGADGTPTLPSSGEAATSAPFVPNTLLDHIAEIPVMLVVAADLRCIAMMDAHLDRVPLTGGASIYPFCWNLLLAARARGLGGVLTTFLARAEREAAADVAALSAEVAALRDEVATLRAGA
ncbi:MAG TPA: hypothetical protein PLV68_13695, partial [Ilumatobacteraceae bacterium]|nr:hypothetical protein [Ilumatobacteraceae bacterium]